MERLVAIDLSRAYLLARHNFESKKVLDDKWLSRVRRYRAGVLYIEIGKDFNEFFIELKMFPPAWWYRVSVYALETFRDNLDEVWHYSYSGICREIVWLRRQYEG